MASVVARAAKASHLFTRGTSVVDLGTKARLKSWLRKQSGAAPAVVAYRWSLRALPMIAVYRSDLLPDLVLPIFRGCAGVRALLEHSDSEPMDEPLLRSVTAAAAKAFEAASRAARAADPVQGASTEDENDVSLGFAFVARAFAAATGDDTEIRAFAADTGARAMARLVGDAAAASFWSAISTDTAHLDKGMAASEVAGSPLWPADPPTELLTLWKDLKAKLHAENQDWQVWTAWYEDRLAGRSRKRDAELAYVLIDEALWDDGAEIVNAEIKRRLEMPSGGTDHSTSIIYTAPVKASAPALPRPIARPASGARSTFKGFFSYSHADAEVDAKIVEAFSSRLEKCVNTKLVNASFTIWRDVDKLRAGDYWDEKIKAEIRSVDIMIVLLTPKWISSDYCRNEFKLFENLDPTRLGNGHILPINAEDLEGQAKFLEGDQKAVYDRIRRIQNQQIMGRMFAMLSVARRDKLIDDAAEAIRVMIDALRGG